MSCEHLRAQLRSITPAGEDDWDGWRRFDEIFEQLRAGPMSASDQREVWAVIERAPECDNDYTRGVIHTLEAVPGYEGALTASLIARPTSLGLTMLRRRINSGLPVDAPLLAALRRHRDEPGPLGKRASELVELLRKKEGKLRARGASPTARSSTRRGDSRSRRRRRGR